MKGSEGPKCLAEFSVCQWMQHRRDAFDLSFPFKLLRFWALDGLDLERMNGWMDRRKSDHGSPCIHCTGEMRDDAGGLGGGPGASHFIFHPLSDEPMNERNIPEYPDS